MRPSSHSGFQGFAGVQAASSSHVSSACCLVPAGPSARVSPSEPRHPGLAPAGSPPDQQHLPKLPEHHVGGLGVAMEVVLGGGRHVALLLSAAHHNEPADWWAQEGGGGGWVGGSAPRRVQGLQAVSQQPSLQLGVITSIHACCRGSVHRVWALVGWLAGVCVPPPFWGKLSSIFAASATFVSGPVATTVSSPSCLCMTGGPAKVGTQHACPLRRPSFTQP